MDIRPNTAGSSGAEAAFGSQNAPSNTEHALGERTISALTASPLTSHEARVAVTSNVVSQLLIQESGHALATQNGNGNGSLESEFLAAREFTMAPPSNDDALAAFFGNSTPNLAQNQDALAALFGEAIATQEGSLAQLTANMDLTGLEVFSVGAGVVSPGQLFEIENALDNVAQQTSHLPEIESIFTSGISETEFLSSLKSRPDNFEKLKWQNGIMIRQEVTDLTAEELLATKNEDAVFSDKSSGRFLGCATAIQNHGAHFLAHVNAQREKKGLPPLEPEKAYIIVSDEIMNKFLQGWAKDLEKQAELKKEDSEKANKKTPELQRTTEGERILKNRTTSTGADTDTAVQKKSDFGVEMDRKRESQRIDERNTENVRDVEAQKLKRDKADQAKMDSVLHRENERENLKSDRRIAEKNRSQEKT